MNSNTNYEAQQKALLKRLQKLERQTARKFRYSRRKRYSVKFPYNLIGKLINVMLDILVWAAGKLGTGLVLMVLKPIKSGYEKINESNKTTSG